MSFGVWLWQNRNANSDTTVVHEFANSIAGSLWPIAAKDQQAYVDVINRSSASNKADVLVAFQRVWPDFNSSDLSTKAVASKSGFWTNVASLLLDFRFWLTILSGLVFYFAYDNFNSALRKELADAAISRGVITFLVAIAAVGIAMITVVNSFLGAGPKEDLAERFRQGKDVLSVLIGVLGTIVGFYFAQNLESPRPLSRSGNFESRLSTLLDDGA